MKIPITTGIISNRETTRGSIQAAKNKRRISIQSRLWKIFSGDIHHKISRDSELTAFHARSTGMGAASGVVSPSCFMCFSRARLVMKFRLSPLSAALLAFFMQSAFCRGASAQLTVVPKTVSALSLLGKADGGLPSVALCSFGSKAEPRQEGEISCLATGGGVAIKTGALMWVAAFDQAETSHTYNVRPLELVVE
jgi:hypothetical protein